MGTNFWLFLSGICLGLFTDNIYGKQFNVQSPLKSSFRSPSSSLQKPLSSIIRNQFSLPMTAVGQKGRKTAKSNQLSKKSSSENDSISSFLLNKIKSVPPATRLHLLLSLLCTFVQLLGLPAAQLFPLDPARPYEVWRIITSMTYFGPPSLYMANSLWFMVRYGQTYESEVGSVNHLWFLIIQTLSLSIFGFVMGYRYQARSLLAAVVYASSQLRPTEKMRAQFGLTISSWQMPFLLMALDCLSSKSLLSAWPHVMGIFSGFLYNFIKQKNSSLLMAPKWIHNLYGPKRKSPITENPVLDIISSGAVIPPPPPVQDYRKIKLEKEFLEGKQKLKYQKKTEKSPGIRLGSKIEELVS